MRTKRTRGYIDETAKEFGITPVKVQEVTESMFRFVTEIMTEGNKKLMDFGEVRVMGWGVFKVKPGRKRFFEKYNSNERNKRVNGGK